MNPEKYEVRDVPVETVPLLFPKNYIHLEITAERMTLSASVDLDGLVELTRRLHHIEQFLACGPMPQPPAAQGIEAPSGDETRSGSAVGESAVAESDAPESSRTTPTIRGTE